MPHAVVRHHDLSYATEERDSGATKVTIVSSFAWPSTWLALQVRTFPPAAPTKAQPRLILLSKIGQRRAGISYNLPAPIDPPARSSHSHAPSSEIANGIHLVPG